ncbi:hypothetical protein E0H22_23400 [Rhodopseudomonas boonkerdii]|uniref:LPS translocon maturation chaperone LptM n=1 Tax=Rhodopseudomonas boonkerdii TaxID=475937 RepID=UPI001E555D79|nr:lipoprotein [Rhodopseudomonas boonkerdii]UGV28361.1 hypothetical protein E0H22_23400 [Rhodopseudomonas boonkerdii]
MTRSTRPARAPSRTPWALIVLTVSALALGACGRKGGLDLPPQAAATPMGTPAVNADNSAANKGNALTSSNQPDDVQAARGRKRSFFLDPLLD